jgi:hypothetical protein
VRRRLAVTGGLAALVALAAPGVAHAHGIVGRRDLPVPEATFFWASAAVLVLSFLAIAFLWQRALLTDDEGKRAIGFARPFSLGAEIAGGLVGVAAWAFVIYAGYNGAESPTANIAPTFIFVIFWVGIPFLSFLFGDVFRLFNPWRAIGRAVGAFANGASGGKAPEPFAYPRALGYWPAVIGLLAFAWLELASGYSGEPPTLATATLVYSGVQLLGMAFFGVEPWTRYGDAFAVVFNFFSRLSPLNWRADGLHLRKPLAGLVGIPLSPGLIALLCVMIGTTAFDGASEGAIWSDLAPDIQRQLVDDLGISLADGLRYANTIGLLAVSLIVGLFYAGGMLGMRMINREWKGMELARYFVVSFVPIALAYVVAHYFSLLAFQGQAMGYLISDPLGDGSDWFGTAETVTIDYTYISATAVWYVQVISLVVGHVSALFVAHDRALARFSSPREATLSQLWMLVVMVGFTVLGLYLLSAASQ